MPRRLHAILADYGGDYGWGVTSPQLPGLAGGRETFKRLSDDLPDILRFAGMPPGSKVVTHVERPFETDHGTVFVQMAYDEQGDRRVETARRLGFAFADKPDSRLLDLSDAPRDRAGDVRLICAVAEDTFDWIVEQLRGPGDAVVVVVPIDIGGEPLGVRQMYVIAGESSGSSGYDWLEKESYRTPLGTLIGSTGVAPSGGERVTKVLVEA